MTPQPRILLDWRGDALVPPGYTLIDTEVGFLNAALCGSRMVVRGVALCRWAEEFYRGRGIHYSDVVSPLEALRSCYPELNDDQLAALRDDLGDNHLSLSQPIQNTALINALYPEGPWQERNDIVSAAHWLLWLDHTNPPDHHQPLLARWANERSVSAPEDTLPLWAVSTAKQANEMLKVWLCLSAHQSRPSLEMFPLDVPDSWQGIARREWARVALNTAGQFVLDLPFDLLPHTLRDIAVYEAYGFFSHNPEKLDQTLVALLSRYLPAEEARRLRRMCPPESPDEPPATLDGMISWFQEAYLPYRLWQIDYGENTHQQVVETLATSFARSYLRAYATALAGGAGRQWLGMSTAAMMRERRNEYVTLWVILDGLPVSDINLLCTEITRQSPELSTTVNNIVCSPIPTITHFCKPVMLNGAPSYTLPDLEPVATFEGARQLKPNKDPSGELKDARLGDIYVWSFTEPDETYHKPFDRKIIRANVDGVIKGLAVKIGNAALAILPHLQTRVVISTDHGRLLGASERTVDVPAGMQAHQRAAWGKCDVIYSNDGVYEDESNSLVFLSSERFGLPDDCSVILNSAMFLKSDGRTGREEFAHGGLYPEEVFLPWVELACRRSRLDLSCHVSGNEPAGSPGNIVVQIDNPSDYELTVTELTIEYTAHEAMTVKLNNRVKPRSVFQAKIPIDQWPTKKQIQNAVARMAFVQADGNKFECGVEMNVFSIELYSQENLADLLGDDFNE